jgi:4'-phosphopantetheinyl transferase
MIAAGRPDAGEVGVWRVELDAEVPALAGYLGDLAPDERERAGRFHFERDRCRFVIARGVLRRLLAEALGSAPGEVAFRYGRHGKPELAGGQAASRLRFNVAHSDGLALFALAWGRGVGIDVERVRSGIDGEGIARRFFSAHEVAALHALPAAVREQAFFRCWTCKEAYVKALGQGLSLGLDRFDVSLDPAAPVALLAHRGAPEAPSRWMLVDVAAAPGYAAALAVERWPVAPGEAAERPPAAVVPAWVASEAARSERSAVWG